MSIIDDLDLSQKGKAASAAKTLDAHVLLDRSGSMGAVQAQTVDAFNEYVNGLANTPGLDALISLTIFDSASIDLIRDRVPVKNEAAKLKPEEFQPRASTPLNDAIGATATRIREDKRLAGNNVAFVILTDGQENASREYKLDAVKALLKQAQDELGWLVVFLGANQDSFSEGVAQRGTMHAHTMDFQAANVQASMRAASRASGTYGLVGDAGADGVSFTAEERKQATGGKPDNGTT